MTAFVLDASVTLGWCFKDEASPEGDALLDRLGAGGAVVPSLWYLEIANILSNAQRKGRITAQAVMEFLLRLRSLPIIMDTAHPEGVQLDILSLCHQHGLTAYDAAYLELACRMKLPLATKDSNLAKAAREQGCATL